MVSKLSFPLTLEKTRLNEWFTDVKCLVCFAVWTVDLHALHQPFPFWYYTVQQWGYEILAWTEISLKQLNRKFVNIVKYCEM